MNFKWVRRLLFALLLASSVLIAYDTAFTNVTAEEGDDEVDGVLTSQNFNNAAAFTGFKLVTGSGATDIASGNTISPQVSYTAEITINDPDGIRDITSVAIRFFNSTQNGEVTAEAITSDFTAADATNVSGQEFVVNWNYGEEGFSVVYDDNVTSGSVTWEIVDSETPTGSALLGTSFTFRVEFKASKVAQESESNLKWYFGGIIRDGRISLDNTERSQQDPNTVAEGFNTDNGYADDTDVSYWNMNWYGEISVDTQQVSWTDLPAGITFGAIGDSVTTISGIKYVSNGDYDSQIAADRARWDAVMTSSLAAVLFRDEGFESNDFSAFEEKYKENYSTYSQAYYMPEGDNALAKDIDTWEDMVGIPYAVINDVSDSLTTSRFNGFEILLPKSIDGVNQTGAAMVLSSGSATEVAYEDLIDGTSDINDHQYFAISYKNKGVDITSEEVELDGSWYLVGAGGDQWRSFRDENQSILNTRSYEVGQTGDLALYIQLSEIFQNAEYRGEFQLKIVNR